VFFIQGVYFNAGLSIAEQEAAAVATKQKGRLIYGCHGTVKKKKNPCTHSLTCHSRYNVTLTPLPPTTSGLSDKTSTQ